MFKSKKPYFDMDKYIADTTINKDSVLINLLNNNPNWFDDIEKQPLIQVERNYFKSKIKGKEFFWIEKSWITWR
jgi:hypothetical protein